MGRGFAAAAKAEELNPKYETRGAQNLWQALRDAVVLVASVPDTVADTATYTAASDAVCTDAAAAATATQRARATAPAVAS